MVISEADLMKAVDIIKSSLEDLDKVRAILTIVVITVLNAGICAIDGVLLQLEDIPGEVESEKGHQDTITN